MLRCELADRRKTTALLGVAETVGGGSGEMLLLGQSGGLQWTSGGLVKVRRCLNCIEECCGGSCGLG